MLNKLNLSPDELQIAMKFKEALDFVADFFIENPNQFERLKEYAKNNGKNTEMMIVIQLIASRMKEREGGDGGN